MQKWEYCYITGVYPNSLYGRLSTNDPARRTFTSKPPYLIVEEFKKRPRHEEIIGMAKIIAEMGEEGWEMAGIAQKDGIAFSIFFKRPIE